MNESKIQKNPKILDTKTIPGRQRHFACALSDQAMIILGGLTQSDQSTTTNLQLYLPQADLWFEYQTITSHPLPQFGFAGVYFDRFIALFGGLVENQGFFNDLHIMDLHLMTWRKVAPEGGPTPEPRQSPTGWYYDHKLWYFGGCLNNWEFSDELLCFDLTTRRWSWPETQGPSPCSREEHTTVMVNDHLVLLYGGDDFYRSFADIHLLDLRTLTWSLIETLGRARPLGRYGHSATMIHNNLVVYGGWNHEIERQSDLWTFDTERYKWEKEPFPHKARLYHSAVTIKGKVYIFGGWLDEGRLYNDLLIFKPLPYQPETLKSLSLRAVAKWDTVAGTPIFLIEKSSLGSRKVANWVEMVLQRRGKIVDTVDISSVEKLLWLMKGL